MQIIVTNEEDRKAVDRLSGLIEKALSKDEFGSDKWTMTKEEVSKKMGWSESTIRKKVNEGKLTPLADSDAPNSKVRFYVNEVLSNIPPGLRKKYGDPI